MTTQPTRRPFLGTYQEGTHVSAEVPEGFDWSRWYLTEEEDMGQSLEQFECIALLLSILTTLVRERGQQDDVYVGADQFFQWVQGEESVQVSPDLYIMQPHPPMPRPRSIQTWRRGHHPPRLAIEIVSIDWRKDYDENPPKYAQIGVEELLIFDPDAARNPALPGLEHEQERVALQLYQQHHGGLVCAERGQGPMFSEVLQAWLLVVSTPAGPRLRLSHGPTEEALVPSSPEALERSRDHLRTMHDRLEQALRDHEAEMYARAAAELQRDQAERQREQAERQRDQAELQRDQAERQREQAERQREQAELQRDQAKHQHEHMEHRHHESLHALRTSIALAEAAGADPATLEQLKETLRNLEA